MKITNSEAWKVEMPLEEPYLIAYERIDKAENVFIRIETEGRLQGFGCAAPDLVVTGETADSVLADFDLVIKPILKGSNALNWAAILEDLKIEIPKSKSALAMVDIALHDLLGKKAKIPVYQLLGGFRQSMPTSITIGILSLEETLERGKKFIKQGFKSIKLKGGIDMQQDVEKVMRLREVIGREIDLRFDANQGYSPDQAIRFVNETRHANIEIFEQPTQSENLEHLGLVTKQVHIPVMADESMKGLMDAFHLASWEQMDMVNIKLMKVGGIAEAQQINAVARSAGIESMVGCMDESALGIAAGLHFALSRPNINYADLDGHLDLLNDPAAGAVILRDGILYPNPGPGFGFSF